MRQIVDWSLAEDLHVLINLHHDSWQWINTYPSDPTTVMSRYTALWRQLAGTFRDYSSRVLFESINEPQFAGTSSDEQGDQLVNTLNTEFVRLVRQTGGGNATRVLVLPTLHTSGEQVRLDALSSTIAALRDPNIAATVHFYGYWPFSVNIAGGTRYDSAVEQDLVSSFERAHTTFVSRGIPVIIGEWALLSYDYTRRGIIERGELLKYLEAVGYNARIRNLTTIHPQPERHHLPGTLTGRHRAEPGRRLHGVRDHADAHLGRPDAPGRQPGLRSERHHQRPLLPGNTVADQHHHLRPAGPERRHRDDELLRHPHAVPR